MFLITNKLDVDLSAKGNELIAIFQKLKLNLQKSKREVIDGRIVMSVSNAVAQEALETAVCLSYVGPVAFNSDYLDNDQKKTMEKGTINEYFRTVRLAKVGFYKLEPVTSTQLVHDIEIINNLVKQGIAKYLDIKDTDLGVKIWEGGIVADTVDASPSMKAYDKALEDDTKPRQAKVTRVGNLLHPDQLCEVFYPEAEIEVEPETDFKKLAEVEANDSNPAETIQELQQAYLEKFGTKAPGFFNTREKLITQLTK